MTNPNICRPLRIISCLLFLLLWPTNLRAESLTMNASASDSAITLTLAGGAGAAPSSFSIYRATVPSFVPGSATLIATSTTLISTPYVDHKELKQGTVYYYKIVGKAADGSSVPIAPANLGQVNPALPLALSVMLKLTTLNIVYLGDSITYGANLPAPDTQAPPVICSECLRGMAGIRDVYFSNQGHSGHTTEDFLPGRGDFAEAEKAAQDLKAKHDGALIFTIMLGTNDSANSGTTGCPMKPETYRANLAAIIDHLLADFPDAMVVLNIAPWYSPNTHNGANYEETGLARLISYFPQFDTLVSAYAKTAPGHVVLGDRMAFSYFSQTYLTDLVPEGGANGTFFLHPNPKGAAQLGTFWAQAILPHLIATVK